MSSQARDAASIAAGHAKVVTGEAALDIGQGIFRICGASATLEKYGLDRHWRNARTLTLHDPMDQILWDVVNTGIFRDQPVDLGRPAADAARRLGIGAAAGGGRQQQNRQCGAAGQVPGQVGHRPGLLAGRARAGRSRSGCALPSIPGADLGSPGRPASAEARPRRVSASPAPVAAEGSG